jgi:hypothetical protein
MRKKTKKTKKKEKGNFFLFSFSSTKIDLVFSLFFTTYLKRECKMENIYIIYDTDNGCWRKSYREFEEAIDAVMKWIQLLNSEYAQSPDFKTEPQLPGAMDTYKIHDVESGIIVANLYEGKTQIYIKEIELY